MPSSPSVVELPVALGGDGGGIDAGEVDGREDDGGEVAALM